MNKKRILQELQREKSMRRKVWKNTQGLFVEREKQDFFDHLSHAVEVLDEMSDAEFNALVLRIERRKKQDKPHGLFDE